MFLHGRDPVFLKDLDKEYEAAREKIPLSTNSGDFDGFLWNHRCMGMGWTYRRAESIVTIEIFRGKKIWKKNIIFS